MASSQDRAVIIEKVALMISIPEELEGILVSTPDTLHGAVRFAGSRVFASQLFDYLLGGESLESFLEDFEPVTRQQAEAVMAWELKRVRSELEVAV